MDETLIAKLPSENICRVNADIKRLAICIRHYLGTNANGDKDEYGGVALPAIKGIDIHSLKEIQAPERTESNIEKVTGQSFSKIGRESGCSFLLGPERKILSEQLYRLSVRPHPYTCRLGVDIQFHPGTTSPNGGRI